MPQNASFIIINKKTTQKFGYVLGIRNKEVEPFLSADCKSAGTPSGLAFLPYAPFLQKLLYPYYTDFKSIIPYFLFIIPTLS